MLFVYRIFYAIGFVILFPYMLYTQYVGRKPMHLLERFWPKFDALGECILVHAVSVGETHAVAPLVFKLMKAFPNKQFVITNVTHTGNATARKLFPGAKCLFLPFDFPWSVRRFFSRLHPELVIISEGDLWPEFLHQAQARTIIVNCSVSDRTYRRLSWFPSIARWRFHEIDFFCLQNEVGAQRLLSLGIEPSRLSVTGSMKADCSLSPLSFAEKASLQRSLGIREEDTIIMVASTHEPEEMLICSVLRPLLESRSDIRILVAPRHPERFSKVYDALSQTFQNVANLDTAATKPWRILVIDAMGRLSSLYQISHLAIVAGSFVKSIGGHNIIEPALAQIPVLVGPYMHSQRALIDSSRAYKAVIEITESTLCAEISNLLSDPTAYKNAVDNVHAWVCNSQGASDRTLKLFSL